MLNLAVHIVTTAIQSVEVYRICICYFFTKYNNNIADCLHSIKSTSSVPNTAVCLCNIKHSVDRDRWRYVEPLESVTSLHCWDLHSSSVGCHSWRAIDQPDNGESPWEIAWLIKRSDVSGTQQLKMTATVCNWDHEGHVDARSSTRIWGRWGSGGYFGLYRRVKEARRLLKCDKKFFEF